MKRSKLNEIATVLADSNHIDLANKLVIVGKNKWVRNVGDRQQSCFSSAHPGSGTWSKTDVIGTVSKKALNEIAGVLVTAGHSNLAKVIVGIAGPCERLFDLREKKKKLILDRKGKKTHEQKAPVSKQIEKLENQMEQVRKACKDKRESQKRKYESIK